MSSAHAGSIEGEITEKLRELAVTSERTAGNLTRKNTEVERLERSIK